MVRPNNLCLLFFLVHRRNGSFNHLNQLISHQHIWWPVPMTELCDTPQPASNQLSIWGRGGDHEKSCMSDMQKKSKRQRIIFSSTSCCLAHPFISLEPCFAHQKRRTCLQAIHHTPLKSPTSSSSVSGGSGSKLSNEPRSCSC